MIRVERAANHEEASRYAADWVARALAAHREPLLCVASGGTPTRAYELIAEWGRAERAAVATLRVLKLDEWLGLDEGAPGSCEEHLRSVLVEPLGLGDRYAGFASNPGDPAVECRRIAAWLEAKGPIDVCVLGLGVNGHLGFNEPGPALRPHAHVAELSEASLGHAMTAAMGRRPTGGITLGMADLLQARRVLVIATGESKRGPVRRLLAGEVSTEFPATLLHLHADATLVTDVA